MPVVVALGADPAQRNDELLRLQQHIRDIAALVRRGHSTISMPSAAISQPAASTARRSTESASRAGLLLLMWMKMRRSEEHTSELRSLMRISYAVFCLKKKTTTNRTTKVQLDTKTK